MPEPTEILKQTGQGIAHSNTEATSPFISEVPNESQRLETVTKELQGVSPEIKPAGPNIPVQTNHEATTATVTPITMPAAEESVDKAATPWWKNILRMRQQQQEEKEELPDAA